MMHKNIFAAIYVFTIIILLFPHPVTADYPNGYYRIDRIIDGDTFVLTDGTKVKLIGIDAPEEGERCSAEASRRLTELIANKSAYLERDVSEIDRYGSLLRYVYSENGIFVNLALIQEGYAVAAEYPPDTKHAEQFSNAEQYARENDIGCLWGKENNNDEDHLYIGC